MTPTRWTLLILGPLPIVAGSMLLSSWARSLPHPPLSPNIVVRQFPEADRPDQPESLSEELRWACGQRGRQLEHQLGASCAVLVRSPFVLGGDLQVQQLQGWYRNTIQPAARAMAGRYFHTPPNQPITVLLFSNETSYNYFADHLFNECNVSVYGYYKPKRRTLILNIATGSGTLVHELTHALLAFDFPRAPDWLNEGLASLHEQGRFREEPDGVGIEGLVNWRLPILIRAIRQGQLPSLVEMLRDADFRGRHEAVNYAQARYFCLYLQRRGLLARYYRQLRADWPRDPLGEITLAEMFPGTSWPELDQRFRHWALTLDNPSHTQGGPALPTANP